MNDRNKPRVAVLMGSDSDLPTMKETGELLERFSVPYTTRITSAHRSARATLSLAETLEKSGVEVFIVGAGLAAHLAGAVAAVTTRPVIGVPMAGGSLNGLDALYSTVQMPSGVPVATMAIGRHGAKNAAILAVQILALSDAELAKKLTAFKEDLERSVEEKDSKASREFEAAAEAIREMTEEGQE
jgi:5-(carboxyamino)imidazole ribonucleotide mutase